MQLVLELNDAALSLHQDDRILYQQQAIAYLDGDTLVFGDAALRNARQRQQLQQVPVNQVRMVGYPPAWVRQRLRVQAPQILLVYLLRMPAGVP